MTPDNDNSRLSSLIDFLESSWRQEWLTRFIYYILFIDVFCFSRSGVGLSGIALNTQLQPSFADLAGMIILLGLFTSLVVFVLFPFFKFIMIEISCLKIFNFSRDNLTSGPSFNKVSMCQLREDALNAGDAQSFTLYTKELSKLQKMNSENYKKKSLTFGALIILIIEYLLTQKYETTKLLVEWLWEFKSSLGLNSNYNVFILCLLIYFFLYTIWICWPDYKQQHEIYYPKLAKKLLKKNKKTIPIAYDKK